MNEFDELANKEDKALLEEYENNQGMETQQQVSRYLDEALELDGGDPAYRERLLKMVVKLGIPESDPLFLVLVATSHLRLLLEKLPEQQEKLLTELSQELEDYRSQLNQALENSEKHLSQSNYRRAKEGMRTAIAESEENRKHEEQQMINRIASETFQCQLKLQATYEQVAKQWEEKIKGSQIKRQDQSVIVLVLLSVLVTGAVLGYGVNVLLERPPQIEQNLGE